MALDSGWRKLKNKITDTINKDKWDRSCLNPALLGAVEESGGGSSDIGSSAESFDTTNFQKQLDERNARLEMSKPAPSAEGEFGTDLLGQSGEKTEEPVLDFLSKPVEDAPVEEKPLEDAPVEDASVPKAPVVPGIPSYTPTPSAVAALYGGMHSESSESADLNKEDAFARTEESTSEKDTPEKTKEPAPVGFVSKCYYVKLIHENTYPREGSVRIMRSCDHEYVWTDSIAETEIPTCTVCGNCGKPVEYTEVRMP